MNSLTAKIVFVILIIVVLQFAAQKVISMFSDDYKTETATLYSSAEKLSFNGVYVRDEQVVTSNANGVLNYPNVDGSKIAKNSVVAYVYRSEEDIFVNKKIESLREEVELLEKEQSPGTTDVAQPEFISALIEEKYQTVSSMIVKNDLEGLAEERKNFQSLLGIYQIVINKETDYNDKIDELNKEIKELERKRVQPVDMVTVPDSGYFISYVDGYENVLSNDKISSLTVEKIEEIVENDGYDPSNISSRAVGKLVAGYKWTIVGVADIDDSVFKLGSDVKVKLPSTRDSVDAKIEDIIKTDDEQKSILVLSCDKLNYNLVQYRTERIELILNDFSGIKVPRSAIRFNKQNELGVYILEGQRVSFKKLDVIFECDDYLLSGITSDKNYISVYDEIIVSGEIPEEVLNQQPEKVDEEEDIIPDVSVTSAPITVGETVVEPVNTEDTAESSVDTET